MRTLHVIDELRIGGAQTHLYTVLQEASRTQADEHRVVSLFSDGPVGDSLRELGIQTDSLGLGVPAGKSEILRGMGVLRKIVSEMLPDVVEAHLTWSRLMALPVAWLAGTPCRIGFEQGDLYMNSLKIRSANLVGQFFAHRIIVCSQALADWAGRMHGFQRRRMLVMHNCVNTSRFRPDVDLAIGADLRLAPGTTKFCTVGTLGMGVNKRVDVAIRAVAIARERGAEVGLIVCGDGEQRSALENLAESLGIGGFVVFLGMRRDVPEIMAVCDGFCHAAPFEPFGIVCLEAMACGLPVLVPASGGIQEAVRDGKTGLLYPALDHEALGRLMMNLHFDKDLRELLGSAARASVVKSFSATQYNKRLRGLYIELKQQYGNGV